MLCHPGLTSTLIGNYSIAFKYTAGRTVVNYHLPTTIGIGVLRIFVQRLLEELARKFIVAGSHHVAPVPHSQLVGACQVFGGERFYVREHVLTVYRPKLGIV